MDTPTPEQVRTIAPDASAARAAEALADPRRWSGAGRGASAAWGLCQGSGSQPYQVAVDLGGPASPPAYRCSCPSRKIPCKHALGLLFLLAGGSVPSADPPEWAFGWLASRATRATAAAARTAEPPRETDEAARARRIERREAKVLAGIEELDRWLGDLMRRGLDSARGEGYRFWDAMAARLVDAQAASLGRSVRGLGSAASAGEAWPHLLLEGTARLHLLSEAYRRAETLPEGLRADVRSLVGWTTKEDELGADDEVDDRWLVVGRRVDDSGQVITARTFLLGEATARFALHLAFGVDAAPPTVLALPGQAFRARLAFYPSSTPLRAAVRPVLSFDGGVAGVPGALTIAAVLRAHADRLAVNPFAGSWPVAVRDVVPVRRDDRLLVRDGAAGALRVEPAWLAPRMLAVSGGRPVAVVGEWDGAALRPLGVLAEGRYVGIEATDADAGDGAPAAARFRDGDPAWSRLVSAALLGTERTGGGVPVPEAAASVVSERDRERAILASAAVLAVRRRAGRRAEADREPLPGPAPDDPRPALDREPARLLAVVVTEEPALLGEALGLLTASGRRPPDELLPELLAIAARNADARDAVAPLLGPRARWLATLVPDLAAGLPKSLADANTAWDDARGGRERAAIARSLRAADAEAARVALARWLPDTPGDQRAGVVDAFEVGLGPDDEPLLAAALADARSDVRRAAARLLALVDGSPFATMLEQRARGLLTVRGRLRPGLAVTLPEPGADLEAAGLGGRPPAGYGERAWLLRQLLGHVRPSRWVGWLGADAPQLVERALRLDEARPVLEGWLDAAVRFRDARWLAALAEDSRVAEVTGVDLARAVGNLAPETRAALALAVARSGSVDPVALARLASACPAPWPPALADAVLDAGRTLGQARFPDPAQYELIRTAARGLPPDRADDLVELASWDGQLRPALGGAIDTIRFRARLHAAFHELPPLRGEGQP